MKVVSNRVTLSKCDCHKQRLAQRLKNVMSPRRCSSKKTFNLFEQGRINGKTVAYGWVGTIMRKPLANPKYLGSTYLPTYLPTYQPTNLPTYRPTDRQGKEQSHMSATKNELSTKGKNLYVISFGTFYFLCLRCFRRLKAIKGPCDLNFVYRPFLIQVQQEGLKRKLCSILLKLLRACVYL